MHTLPNPAAESGFLEAFATMVKRIEESIHAPPKSGPVRMYIAGGAAVHFYTAARVTSDIDATFSHRLLLPQDLEVVWRDQQGIGRVLYFDRQYNDTFGLMHEDAYEDSVPFESAAINRKRIEVRVLAPVDLAVSKIARFADHDQDDIKSLAAAGLLEPKALKRRAEEALGHYVGNPAPVKTSIRFACELVEQSRTKPRRPAARKRAPGYGKRAPD